MEAAKRVAKNTGILYARMGITVLMSLYTTRLILNSLGVEDFGIFNVVSGVILMLGFLQASMSEATLRFMSHARGSKDLVKVRKIFNVSIVLHVAIAIALVLILEIAGYFIFGDLLNIEPARLDAARMVYHFLVISTVFAVVSVPFDAVITAYENMILFAILGILEAVLKLGIALFITYTIYDKLIVYGILTAGLSLILLLVRLFYCPYKYSECKLRLRAFYDKTLLNEMTRFAGWSLLGISATMISSYGQGMVINIFFGTAVSAAQGISSQVSGQLGAFATTMLRALNPVIAKSEGAGDRQLMLNASMTGSKVSFFLLMLMCIPVMVEMPFIFKVWLKTIPEYAIIFCRLLLLRNLIEQLFYTLIASIAAVGKIKGYQMVSSLLACVPLPATYFLYNHGYPPSALYIVFIGYSLLTSCNILYFAKKHCDLSLRQFLTGVVFRCVLCFSAVAAFSSLPILVMNEGPLRMLFVLGFTFLSFLGCTWLLGLSAKEQGMVRKAGSGLITAYSAKSRSLRAANSH